MKSWVIASLLTLFPITGWCGAHHAYLGNDRRFYTHIISFFLLFYIIFNTVPRENISAVLAITLLFFTMLNWYNAYGYIRFGLMPVKGKTNFWNDAWTTNWNGQFDLEKWNKKEIKKEERKVKREEAKARKAERKEIELQRKLDRSELECVCNRCDKKWYLLPNELNNMTNALLKGAKSNRIVGNMPLLYFLLGDSEAGHQTITTSTVMTQTLNQQVEEFKNKARCPNCNSSDISRKLVEMSKK